MTGVDPPRDTGHGLRDWYRRPTGQMLLDAVERQFERLLPRMFGYHAAFVGEPWAAERLLAPTHIRHRAVLGPSPGDGASVCARPESLPFEADSVDLVVLFHALELSPDPHAVLREVHRVLIPNGHLILVAFNPYSSWGLARVLRRGRYAPWQGHYYGPRRLKDWLLLLGLDLVDARSLFFRPPLQGSRLQQRLRFLERALPRVLPFAGAVNLLVAGKRVLPLTPTRPRWRARRRLVGTGVIEPTTREAGHARRG